MTQWEYTYLRWEGSITNGRLGQTTPPISGEVIDKLNALGADGLVDPSPIEFTGS